LVLAMLNERGSEASESAIKDPVKDDDKARIVRPQAALCVSEVQHHTVLDCSMVL
jgi:hypothetical protein